MCRDPSAAAQNVAGDGERVGRRADIVAGIMQHQVLDMDELAVDPERGAGIGKMQPLDPARSHDRAGDALVESGQGRGCRRERPQE